MLIGYSSPSERTRKLFLTAGDATVQVRLKPDTTSAVRPDTTSAVRPDTTSAVRPDTTPAVRQDTTPAVRSVRLQADVQGAVSLQRTRKSRADPRGLSSRATPPDMPVAQ